MGFLLLFAVAFAGAENIVELEPVKASPGNTYHCNDWSHSDNYTACKESPYCRWFGGTTKKCYDDPCLKLMTTGSTCGGLTIEISSSENDAVSCQTVSNLGAKWTNADCGDNQEVQDLCVQTPSPPDTYDGTKYNYCFYAQLRDGSCPSSVCREYDPHRLDSTLSKHCIPNDKSGCEILSTSDECGLVPKCFWKNSKCITDPCYVLEEDITGTCANYHPAADATATCAEFKPFKKNGGGSVATYCVSSANNKANLCYLGTPGTLGTSADDYGETYPTLNISSTGSLVSRPVCVNTGTDCDNMGTCVLTVNKRGGLAGVYCSDGTHGAASNLRIPSLVAVLLVVLFSVLNL